MEVLGFIFFIGIMLVVGVFVLYAVNRLRLGDRARQLEEEIRNLTDFDPADVYVSKGNASGVAIDRERRLVALGDVDELRVLPITSIVSCEVLEDGVQLAYATAAAS